MKHKIYYSEREQLYQIATKHLFGKWETRKNYLYTDYDGNFIESRGFFTFEQAEEWISDRYPKLRLIKNSAQNKNIGFEF